MVKNRISSVHEFINWRTSGVPSSSLQGWYRSNDWTTLVMISTRNSFTPWNTLDPAVMRPRKDTQYMRQETRTKSPCDDTHDNTSYFLFLIFRKIYPIPSSNPCLGLFSGCFFRFVFRSDREQNRKGGSSYFVPGVIFSNTAISEWFILPAESVLL